MSAWVVIILRYHAFMYFIAIFEVVALNKKSAEYWIEALTLSPHPEGGYFREVFRSEEIITREGLPQRFSGSRNFITSIYYLLQKGEFSLLHRLKSDELWYFHDGSPLSVYVLSGDGISRQVLGLNVASGQMPQIAISAGSWFGALIEGEGEYSLVGCAVAPGFDFTDFELASRETMLAGYPQYHTIIEKLTK